MVDIVKLAAFSNAGEGGMPVGVVILDEFPSDPEMQATAKQAGCTETAFAYAQGGTNFKRWRVRFFGPEMEITFGAAAAAALGSELADRHGAGTYDLAFNNTDAWVDVQQTDGRWESTVNSARTWTRQMPAMTAADFLAAFGLKKADLLEGYDPMVAFAGSQHVVLWVKDKETLQAATWKAEPVRSLMQQADVTTVYLVSQTPEGGFFARDAFVVGGVVEDTATGSAAAALGGLMRDLGKATYAAEDGIAEYAIWQGDELAEASRLHIEFTATRAAPVKVWGAVRKIDAVQNQPAPAAPRGGARAAEAPRAAGGQAAAQAPNAQAGNNPKPGANTPNAKPG